MNEFFFSTESGLREDFDRVYRRFRADVLAEVQNHVSEDAVSRVRSMPLPVVLEDMTNAIVAIAVKQLKAPSGEELLKAYRITERSTIPTARSADPDTPRTATFFDGLDDNAVLPPQTISPLTFPTEPGQSEETESQEYPRL